MKGRKKFKSRILLMMIPLVLAAACEEYTIETKILKDGSCQRTIVVISDSEDIFDGPFVIPQDTSWEKEKIQKKGKNEKFKYTARKSYDSVDDMFMDFQNLQNKSYLVQTPIQVIKRHRWFFTYFSYREIYKDLFPFKSVPIVDYFSPDEISIFWEYIWREDQAEAKYSEETLEDIEERFVKWMGRAIFEDFFQLLVEESKRLDSKELPVEALTKNKEALFEAFLEEADEIENNSEELLKISEKFFQTSFVWTLLEQNPEAFSELDSKMVVVDHLLFDTFTNTVRVPGLITSTNADSVEGNAAIWNFEADKFFLKDFEMLIESRKINWTVVGLAGVFCLALLLTLIVLTIMKRRKKQNF